MTTFLRYFIPGRADHARIIKRAIIYKEEKLLEDKGRNAWESGQRPRTEEGIKLRKAEEKSKETALRLREQGVAKVGNASAECKGEGYRSNSGKAEVNRVRVTGSNTRSGLSVGQKDDGEESEVGDTLRCEGEARTREKSKQKKIVVGFEWGSDQQRSFEHMKCSIILNAMYSGDERKQYHLSTNASKRGLGGVLFQFANEPPGTTASPKN